MKTVSHDHVLKKYKEIWDKVLQEERTWAYATTIDDINTFFAHCEFCSWYKSGDTIVSEARFQYTLSSELFSIHCNSLGTEFKFNWA